MRCLLSTLPNTTIPKCNHTPFSKLHCTYVIGTPALNFQVTSRPNLHAKARLRFLYTPRAQSSSNPQTHQEEEEEEDEEQALVEDLRVPDHWSIPSKASEESEWLKATLHKWLDDEYCPEETNVEISEVAARSYYNSLVEKQTDLGGILLKMAVALETISYQESFHGAFSSANAAVNLIVQRIEQD